VHEAVSNEIRLNIRNEDIEEERLEEDIEDISRTKEGSAQKLAYRQLF